MITNEQKIYIERVSLLNNFNRVKILVFAKEGKYNIKELAKVIGIKPKSTSEHIYKLEKVGLVELKKKEGRGKGLFVYSIPNWKELLLKDTD